MHCPFCKCENTQVLETRYQDVDNTIKRKRKCDACQARFVTLEVAHLLFPLIIKKDKRREAYQRSKLEKSMMIALRKREVSIPKLEQAMHNIEQLLLSSSQREIPSLQIGLWILQELKKMDKVAYMRFASVYQNFADINEFALILQELNQYTDNNIEDK
jgi:transcriptional repressor NrdR